MTSILLKSLYEISNFLDLENFKTHLLLRLMKSYLNIFSLLEPLNRSILSRDSLLILKEIKILESKRSSLNEEELKYIDSKITLARMVLRSNFKVL